METEREILVQTVEAARRRVHESEIQRDALLPQLRSLTQVSVVWTLACLLPHTRLSCGLVWSASSLI